MRVRRTQANPRFVYYFFKNPQTFQMCQGMGGQAAQPNINLTVLKGITLPLPDVPRQDAIVEILSAYDDLIENNRRRIALLEEKSSADALPRVVCPLPLSRPRTLGWFPISQSEGPSWNVFQPDMNLCRFL